MKVQCLIFATFSATWKVKGCIINLTLSIILNEMHVKKSFERSEEIALKATEYIHSNISQTQSKITIR